MFMHQFLCQTNVRVMPIERLSTVCDSKSAAQNSLSHIEFLHDTCVLFLITIGQPEK